MGSERKRVCRLKRRTASDNASESADAFALVDRTLQTEGSPLTEPAQQMMGSRFGHDFSQVRIHTDAAAAQSAAAVNAHAYNVGSDIVFGPGQYAPHSPRGQRLIAHELTHVAQQQAGAPLALRRAVKTLGGNWDTDSYTTENDGTQDVGVDIDLKFTPEDPVDAKKIGMTQTANSILAGKPLAINNTVQNRSVPAGEPGKTEGAHIDRISSYGNPLYATDNPSAGDKLGTTPTLSGWGQHGWHYKDMAGTAQHQDAHLKDTPQLPGRGADASQIFETTAVAVEGAQENTYYGSVQWGWKTDSAGTFSRLPLTIVSAGNPSPTFQRAAELWNTNPTSTGANTLDLPVSQVSSLAVDPTTLSTPDLLSRISTVNGELVPLAPGIDKTNKEFEKKALEAELLKRNIKVTVKVHETEDWIGSDNVYVSIAGFGKSLRTGEKKLNNGETGDFLIPLSGVMWGATPGVPFVIHIYDADWPDADDLMFDKVWLPPYSPVTDTQSRDGGRYEATIQFDR